MHPCVVEAGIDPPRVALGDSPARVPWEYRGIHLDTSAIKIEKTRFVQNYSRFYPLSVAFEMIVSVLAQQFRVFLL